MRGSKTRRAWLIGAVSSVVAVSTRTAAACIEFLATEEGPFFPRDLEIPNSCDLTRVTLGGASAAGEIIHVGGLVFGPDCKPLNGARVTIWQADSNGQYKHATQNNLGQLDPNFQYFGKVQSQNGRFRFKTVRPAPYSFQGLNRARHIHFEVSHPEIGRMTTEMYFGGSNEDERRRGDKVWLGRNPQLRESLIRTAIGRTERGSGGMEFPDDIHPAYRFDLHHDQSQN